MPDLDWKHSENGGWFAIDEEGNYWHMSSKKERVTITTPDGVTATGWTPKVAWRYLQEVA